MRQFSAPWSRFLKVMSTIITIIVCVAFWLAAPISSEIESFSFQLFLALMPIIILGASAIFIIRRYEITDEHIEIVRIIGRTKYQIHNIESIEVDPKATELSIRTMGNGGLYSISGLFRNEKLGAYRAYVTNPENCVVIKRKKGSPIVISPDDPTEFAEQIKPLIA